MKRGGKSNFIVKKPDKYYLSQEITDDVLTVFIFDMMW